MQYVAYICIRNNSMVSSAMEKNMHAQACPKDECNFVIFEKLTSAVCFKKKTLKSEKHTHAIYKYT